MMIVLFVGSLLMSLWLCLNATSRHVGVQTRVPVGIPNLNFSADEFVQLGEFTDNVKQLSSPSVVHAKSVQFAMLGEAQKAGKVKILVQVKPFNYHVSMIFISATNQYAVIDGAFVHVGDRLRYGATLKVIRKGKVLISRADGSRWVKIRNSYGIGKGFQPVFHPTSNVVLSWGDCLSIDAFASSSPVAVDMPPMLIKMNGGLA